MAEEFDPDTYLKSDDFDPDAYLGSGQREESARAPSVALPSDASAGQVAATAVRNVPSSAVNFAKDFVQPFIHPIQTAETLRDLGYGVAQKMGLMERGREEEIANSVGQFFADRYGSIDAVKKTFAEDPVGLAGDLSTILTGGGAAAARAPGLIGKAGRVAGQAGRAIDPVNAVLGVARGIETGAGAAANLGAGIMTQVGPRAFHEAAQAGLMGGETARGFRENIMGRQSPEELVNIAQGAIKNLENRRGSLYQEQIKNISGIEKPLSFDKIDEALAEISQVKTFHGVPIDESTQGVRGQIANIISEWRSLPRDVFHTPEGLDALKKKIYNDVRVAPDDTAGHRIKGEAYNAVKQTIIDESPEYAKIMRGYEEASKQIENIRKELSLPNPKKQNISTAFGKLTSALRNNVSTHYGRREELVKYLVEAGAGDLLPRLAGQELRTWSPRGFGKAIGAAQAGAAAGLVGFGSSPAGLALLATLPTMSPRLMGEAAHGLGVGRRLARKVPLRQLGLPAFQAGRLNYTSEGYPFTQGQAKGGRVTKAFRARRADGGAVGNGITFRLARDDEADFFRDKPEVWGAWGDNSNTVFVLNPFSPMFKDQVTIPVETFGMEKLGRVPGGVAP